MANVNVRMKRRTGSSSWDDLFPETTVDQIKLNTSGDNLSGFVTNLLEKDNPSATSFIKVFANGTVDFRNTNQIIGDIGAAPSSHEHTQAQITDLDDDLQDKADLDTSGKIVSSQIPSYLFSGLKFAKTTAGASSEDTLGELLSIADTELGSSTNQQREGAYFVVTTGFTLTHNASNHRILSGDEGDADTSVDLEAGDWIVYVGYGDENNAGSDRHEWAIINNTYRNASTGSAGIVALASGTTTTRAGLNSTGPSPLRVMDEKAVRTVMKDIFYTSSSSAPSNPLEGDLWFEGNF